MLATAIIKADSPNMSSFTNNANVLAAKDTNVPMTTTNAADGQQQKEKDLEYHRQVLKSKMEAQQYVQARHRRPNEDFTGSDAGKLPSANRSGNNYISPSDEIMSPCTAKLNALRNKQVGKYVSLACPSSPAAEREKTMLNRVASAGSSPSPSSPRHRLRGCKARRPCSALRPPLLPLSLPTRSRERSEHSSLHLFSSFYFSKGLLCQFDLGFISHGIGWSSFCLR